jgi:arabinofuranosyltransferase
MASYSGFKGEILDFCGGVLVYYWGGDMYLTDAYGLTDPLLPRLPGIYNRFWRVGHIFRALPSGYRESLQQGKNLLEDPSLAAYYDKILLITRSKDLFSPERLRAIVDINLGKYDYLLDAYYEGHVLLKFE